MSDVPPEERPSSEQPTPRRRIWATAGLTLGAIAALGAIGGAWWAWVFVNDKLSPWVSDFLTESLNRPVALGDVERVSLNRIRFGPSAIPPTETDPDEVYIDQIDVRFNLFQLFRRQLRPQITVEGVRASIAQNEAGQWIETELDLPEQDPEADPLIQVDPTLRIESSEVALLPYRRPDQSPLPLTLGNINGTVSLERVEVEDPEDAAAIIDAQEIGVDISVEPERAGSIILNGAAQLLDYGDDAERSFLDTINANLAIQAQQLDLPSLTPAILASLPEDVPVTVLSGVINGNVAVELTPQTTPQVTGTAQLSDGEVAIEPLSETVENISAQARFQGDRLALENVTAQYANLMARAGGLIDARNGYDLTGEVAPFELAELAEELELDLPVTTTGTFRAEATMTGPIVDPRVTGQLRSTGLTTVDRVQFSDVTAEVVYTPAEIILSSLEILPLAGGRLTGSGTYTLAAPGTLAVQIEGQNLPADALGQLYGVPAEITLGAVDIDGEISGPFDDLNGLIAWQAPGGDFPTRGRAEITPNLVRLQEAVVEVAGGTVSGTGTLAQGQWQADLIAQGIQPGVFEERLAGTTVSGDVQLAGRLDDLTLPGIRANGDITAALRGGTLNSQVALSNGNWTADVSTRGFPAGQFVPQLPLGGVDADLTATGNIADLTPTGIVAAGTVAAAIAGGTVTSDIELANGAWRARGQLQTVQLRQLAPELQGTASVDRFQLAGTLDNLTPTGIRGRIDSLTLSDGLASAVGLVPQLAALQSPLTTSLDWDGRRIQVEQFETAGLSAQGSILPRFSGPDAPTIAAIDLALSAQDYDLATLPVSLPPLLGLTGTTTFEGRLTGSPEDLNLAGEVSLANLALNDLVFDPLMAGDVFFSSRQGLMLELLGQAGVRDGLEVELLGQQDTIAANYDLSTRQIDFRIQADEALATGRTEGDLLLAEVFNFPVSALNLPPASVSPFGSLRGEVTYASATVNLNTLTTFGQVEVADLGISYLSIDRIFGGFSYDDGVASFYDGAIEIADKDNRGEPIPETVRTYDLSARYAFNQTPEIQATLATEAGQLQDVLEILTIQELADLRRSLVPQDGFIPQSQAEVDRILTTVGAGVPTATFWDQLRRVSEILEIQLQAERQTQDATFPPLDTLEGTFSGAVSLTATLPEDIRLDFDIAGDAWAWGTDFRADSVRAKGSYRDGLISLAPVRFSTANESDEFISYVDLTGSFSLDPENRQRRQLALEVVNLPVDRIPVNKIPGLDAIPFTLTGRLNGMATLAGILTDPTLEGEFEITDGTLNEAPLQQFAANLRYDQARLGVDAELQLVASEDPLTVSAEIPYQPTEFVARSPDNSFFVKADVRDEGLALLNLFTQEVVTWEEGNGEATLDIAGTWYNGAGVVLPIPERFDGLIVLDDATISSDILRDFDNARTPLTGVTGRIRLDQQIAASPLTSIVIVDELTGQFSDGELAARGTFPLFQPLETPESETAADSSSTLPAETASGAGNGDGAGEAADSDDAAEIADAVSPPVPGMPVEQTPLALTLQEISLRLIGLYGGQVNGKIQVGGSLFQGETLNALEPTGPELSGEIDLSNGTVLIPEGDATGSGAAGSSATAQGEGGIPIRFSDLRLLLQDDIRIVLGALLDVEGRGFLSLNGTLTDLRPAGRIFLPSGRVGLFAVALRLAGENDRAEFRGDFDPLLDVTLETALPDTNNGSRIRPTTSPFPPNEIPDTTIEDLGLTQQGNQLVQIQARYTGPSSELANLLTDRSNLELTSTPVRSESEIIALLSGNVVGAIDALGSGGNALGGFATFAGSAILGTIQNFIGDTGPINDFRIFQVAGGSGEINESEDFGAEIGFDVRPNISVSILKVLTNDTPFQYNIRYRLSNQFTLRGTTSFEEFQDRTGVLLEYETRF